MRNENKNNRTADVQNIREQRAESRESENGKL
jgi:hypothetical protein